MNFIKSKFDLSNFIKDYKPNQCIYEELLVKNTKNMENIDDFVIINNLYNIENPNIYLHNNEDKILHIPIRADKKGIRTLCYYNSGAFLEKHVHKGEYEIFLIYGKIKFKNPISGKEEIITSGGYYYNPPNVSHEWICLQSSLFFCVYESLDDW